MKKAPPIPTVLVPLLHQVRTQRAMLREAIADRSFEHIRRFPRRRRRVMPVVSYTDEATWFEPAPMDLGNGRIDRLGLILRWRVSGVVPKMNGQACVGFRMVWDHNWTSRSSPSPALLRGADIAEPDHGDFYFLWDAIHSLYDHYKFLGRWFPCLVRNYWQHQTTQQAILKCGLKDVAEQLAATAPAIPTKNLPNIFSGQRTAVGNSIDRPANTVPPLAHHPIRSAS